MDLVIKDARLTGREGLVDIGLEGGCIAAIEPRLLGGEEISAEGNLVSPSFYEIHIHLDAILTEGDPRPNRSGSLWEGIAIWAERVKRLSREDVRARVLKALPWFVAHGVTHIRTHVDVCDPSLTALKALLEIKAEVAGLIDLQIVAFPQLGMFSFEGGDELVRKAVETGADVIGGIPHYEITREYGVQSVKFALSLAHETGLPVDIHCDETDDDQSRFLETMAAETLRLRLSGRVAASHTTAMHSYNNAYADKLIGNVRRAGLHIIGNPPDNAVLQGRFDHYPIRRGLTRVKELLAAGVNVAAGHDSVMDPWYPMGKGDPLHTAFVLLHLGLMSGREDREQLFPMLTSRPAAIWQGRLVRGGEGLEGHAVAVGNPADLVVWPVPTEDDAIRTLPMRRYVLKRGKVVAETRPEVSYVQGEAIRFLR
ncbi:cytosine deaminase [Meiothermus sp.]|uniref:cytosine deaminase n=1 Tax=Meiothermus sp. TaxID=1955249 RepID=UPI0021DC783E|nr:cytosine deaminase [Meiothermus sp.]GIW35701.1 MAG: cytosine deaminase [Meiothermus sp.]